MQDLVDYLRTHVPLTRHIDIGLGDIDETSIALSAPLEPNLNDKHTAFGGTLATLCTLAGWTMISAICREHDCPVDIVIMKSGIRYLRPVNEDPITARAQRPDDERIRVFGSELQASGWAVLEIDAVVQDASRDAVRFTGTYGARLE